MLTADHLKQAREVAESAVADMPEGELKVAAFSVILGKLLGETAPVKDEYAAPLPKTTRQVKSQARPKTSSSPQTLSDRILSLHADSFFSSQRGLSEVRDELAKNGWHYPLTTLSGTMQELVRPNKELRRVLVPSAPGKKKKIWKYSNR